MTTCRRCRGTGEDPESEFVEQYGSDVERHLPEPCSNCQLGERRPRRGDAVEQWLRAQRNDNRDTGNNVWSTLDNLLDLYRLHADTGTPLNGHACEARAVGDCECDEATEIASKK